MAYSVNSRVDQLNRLYKHYHIKISVLSMSGRGAYYKQKYGGGGRGGGRGASGGGGHGGGGGGVSGRGYSGDEELPHKLAQSSRRSGTASELATILRQIDGRQYPCYKDIYGVWDFNGHFTLHVDHVQGDAYASPSRMRVQVPHSVSQIPPVAWQGKVREVAARDFFARRFAEAVARAGGDMRQNSGGGWHSAKGGDITVDTPGQAVLERTAVILHRDYIEARFTLALPASGRTVMGKLASTSLIDMLPQYVSSALLYNAIDKQALRRHVESVEDSAYLRQMLPSLNLVSFVANGSILPRKSGASDEPMVSGSAAAESVIPFNSPPSLQVELNLPNRGTVAGMGIPRGVTLITGGGFHGKSTLLKALERGVYDHIPGDGRELVVSDAAAVKIRAEDGRNVACVDISTFIGDLPYGKRTDEFSTPDASGSTSQAANIQEALEAGSNVLLLDEDTCATNFMIRDTRMQLLVSGDKEPIKPFIMHLRNLVKSGTSTVMVIGGCGEFFDVADHVIMMDAFKPHDVTQRAKEISAQFQNVSTSLVPNLSTTAAASVAVADGNGGSTYSAVVPRVLMRVLDQQGLGSKSFVRNRNLIQFGDLDVDLSCVEQIVDASQCRAIVEALKLMEHKYTPKSLLGSGGLLTVAQMLDMIEEAFAQGGLDVLSADRLMGNLARPRRFEIAAALNRVRSAAFKLAK